MKFFIKLIRKTKSNILPLSKNKIIISRSIIIMKRSPFLETLSWEHHDGLVLAFRIEKGIQKQVDAQTIREYVLHVWKNELVHHFWQEEQSLIDPLQEMDDGKRLVNKMLDHHQHIENQIETIRQSAPISNATLREFANFLNKHIRFEERELFPFIEHNVQEARLNRIKTFLNRHHEPGSKEWKVHFWKD
ncbi:MAG: hypothetical protein GF313_14850 [Caldithrix sp.]|nr:hypothetical protein [Caldithrix sp.]